MAQRRWIKVNLWSHLPAKGLLYFLWAYVFRLGFLDGARGLRYHAMHAIYKHFDEMKLWELRRYKQGAQPGAIRLERSYWQRYLDAPGRSLPNDGPNDGPSNQPHAAKPEDAQRNAA